MGWGGEGKGREGQGRGLRGLESGFGPRMGGKWLEAPVCHENGMLAMRAASLLGVRLLLEPQCPQGRMGRGVGSGRMGMGRGFGSGRDMAEFVELQIPPVAIGSRGLHILGVAPHEKCHA